MNKILIMCLLAFGCHQINTAQSKEDIEKIKTLKVAYFYGTLSLEPRRRSRKILAHLQPARNRANGDVHLYAQEYEPPYAKGSRIK